MRSSCNEIRAARSARYCSASLRGLRLSIQPSTRPWHASASSPGRTSRLALMPCLSALSRDRLFPSADFGPELF